jgi:uncharacterized repeat protein (TIGR01451 family)
MRKILIAALGMLLGSSGAWALTQAGEQIKNTVQLTYTVGAAGNVQTPVDADDGDGFIVDRKIDIQVVENDINKTVDVSPNQQDVDLTFIIANQGNDEETYELTMENLVAPDDDFSPSAACLIDIGDGNGYVAFSPTITIAKETNATVKVQCDIPNTPTVRDDYNATIRLIATANNLHNRPNQCEHSDPDTLGTVATDAQNVCADLIGTGGDLNHDGIHSDNGTYHVKSADLTATKSSCVVSDPVNGTSNPKRIPGAVIRYEIEIKNNGSAEAKDVQVTDPIKAQFGTSAANLDIRTAACPGTDAGTHACAAKTGASEANANTSGAGTNSVTLDYNTVAAGSTECGFIEVTIE